MSRKNFGKTTDDSRREFIRGSSLLLASALPGQSISKRVLRLGLIGCGRSGQLLAGAAMGMGEHPQAAVRLVALADVLPSPLQQAVRGLKGRHGHAFDVQAEGRIVGVDCHQQLVARQRDLALDAVIVAVPVPLRPSIAHAMAVAGIPTYVEQPIAEDQAGVNRFLEAATAAERNLGFLAVGNRQDWAFSNRELCQAVRQGVIGEPQTLFVESSLNCLGTNAKKDFAGSGPDDNALRWERLRLRIAAVELASCIFADEWIQHPQPAVEPVPHEPAIYATRSGKRLIVTCGGSRPGSGRCKLLVHGSAGTADIATGRFWDRDRHLITRIEPVKIRRTSQLEHALSALRQSQYQSNAMLAVSATQLVLS